LRDDSVLDILICSYNYYSLTDVTATFEGSALQVTKQVMYEQRNREARSCDHSCSGKTISVTYLGVCVFSRKYLACNAHALYFI